MSTVHRVAILGFSEFERSTLASCFRLAARRDPSYVQVADPAKADLVVADADHPPSVQLVAVIEKRPTTVFIGASAPAGCTAWMARPIDPLHVMRELDAMADMANGAAPPALQAPAPPPPVPAPAPAPAPATPLAPPSALLVDDSAIAARYLETRLARWGLEITRASNSAQALARLAECDYDFVFLDVELGADSELDGLALCQRIKRNGHDSAAMQTAVVMVSAHHGELDRARGALAGCDAYLGKPLDEVELHRLLLRHGLRPMAAPPASAAAG